MAKSGGKNTGFDLKELLSADGDFLRAVMDVAVRAVLEAEMTQALSAEKSARIEGRQGYRSGYYSRSLTTRVGTLELRVPRDRSGLFSTALFERYQRSEKALVSALAEMYVQGVSTRKVKEVTETPVRAQLLGLDRQRDEPHAGCGAACVCGAAAGGTLSLSDPGCPL